MNRVLYNQEDLMVFLRLVPNDAHVWFKTLDGGGFQFGVKQR